MKIKAVVDGSLIDLEDDKEIYLDSEMDDKVDDIIIKATFAVSGLDPSKIDLFYNAKKWEKNIPFVKLKYEPGTFLYLRPIGKACSCKIF